LITTAKPDRLGELVGGRYRVIRLLASGGMGAVYEALHEVVGRRFAIKFLRAELTARRDMLERFRNEARAAGALESENVAAAVDFGVAADGAPYIVMEYLVGESLASLLEREGRLPLPRAADLVAQACRGVHAAHMAGIVHRDLKPHNLYVCRRVDETDLVKVLDFGVAKLRDVEQLEAATGTGSVLGTPAYMSPEQARGEKIVDERSDVYALGAILYELVAGRVPHPGDSPNASLHHIATQDPVPLTCVQRGLPPGFVAIVQRCLSPLPDARLPSAEALGSALEQFALRSIWRARVPDAEESLSAGSASSTSSGEERLRFSEAAFAAPIGRAPRTLRRLLRRAHLLAILGLGIAAALVGVLYRSTRAPPRQAREPILGPSTRFFVPPPLAGAVQQVAALEKAGAVREAAVLAAMEAEPRAVWFIGGSPEDVESAVRSVLVHAEREASVPILVTYNLPYRDCSQYSAGGSIDSAAYATWIDAFARGIGNSRAVVILEPDSLGIIPYNKTRSGASEWCKPTVTDATGHTVAAPGASPEVRYEQLASALDRIERSAPRAAVYLDGTHAAWLPADEAAVRLVKAGVDRAQGFFVNVANFQTTERSIQYGASISNCIDSLIRPEESHNAGIGDASCAARQYARASDRTSSTHFVVDTSRNGRGPIDVLRYASGPFHQPPAVIAALEASKWCNPPGTGTGPRPTANTGVALVDAYLWVKSPGTSDASCDIVGGGRAWDYSQYNPWGITGDAQKHFDPLWGMVDPTVGDWFPEHATELAKNATPSFEAPSPSDPSAMHHQDVEPDAK